MATLGQRRNAEALGAARERLSPSLHELGDERRLEEALPNVICGIAPNTRVAPTARTAHGATRNPAPMR